VSRPKASGLRRAIVSACAAAAALGCVEWREADVRPLRLVDLYDDAALHGRVAFAAEEEPRAQWRDADGQRAGIASGRDWRGLGEIYRESLIARPGESIHLRATLPRRPWLDLALGTLEEGALTFRVAVERPGEADAPIVLQRTLTTPGRWEAAPVDLARWSGEPVTLILSLSGSEPGAVGCFGSPVVRSRDPELGRRPRAVVFILADTLRGDHLDAYGYRRATAPNLTRVAEEGALFLDIIAQGSWTKVSAPSIFTSLYPRSHGVTQFSSRLSDEVVTLAEIFRDAGYATVGYSSVFFTGQFSNLQQGYEEFHEIASLHDRSTGRMSKTARGYVDRLLAWMEAHADVPFFAFLHVMDPHDPFEPRAPYAALWADPRQREKHLRDRERARRFIRNGKRREFGMPSEADLRAARVNPRDYVEHEMDWYDGSIRGMDAELVRIFEGLEGLGLARESLVVFTSDHGEEFHEHGDMFHGHSLYAELLEVPLLFWGPGRVPRGVRVAALAETLDILPTLLELAGVPAPRGIQGRSLVPHLRASPRKPLAKAAFAEKSADPAGRSKRADLESVAVHSARWKLVHNTKRPEGVPEFELFDRVEDPFEKRNLVNQVPDVAAHLERQIEAWRERTAQIRLHPESADAEVLSAEERERLRALGYVQ
jgi:arylsulfatase A-like enzyme